MSDLQLKPLSQDSWAPGYCIVKGERNPCGLSLKAEWPPASQAGHTVGGPVFWGSPEMVLGLVRGEGSLAQEPAIPTLPFLLSESARLGKCTREVFSARSTAGLKVNKTKTGLSTPLTSAAFSVSPISVLVSAYLLQVELCHRNLHVEFLTPSTSECACNCKSDH